MSDDDKTVAVVLTLIMVGVIIFVSFCWGHSYAVDNMKCAAVKNSCGHWSTDENCQPVFVWGADPRGNTVVKAERE